MYLNIAPYGPRINGVDVAANVYFQKNLGDLSEAEMLALTMLPQNPVALSKKNRIRSWLGVCGTTEEECTIFSEKYTKTRIEKTLFAMAEKKDWTPEKIKSVHDQLKKMRIPKTKNWAYSDFQHFRFFVQDFLEEKKYKPENSKNGLLIRTSLDAELQEKIYALVRERMPALTEKYSIHNIAVLILDNETRSPIAWIGSESFWDESISGQVDMLRSPRQTGSVIKPFIYAAAIAKGYEPPTIFYDSAIRFVGDRKIVSNADGSFLGALRMTDALAKSRNIPAITAFFLAGGESEVRKYLDFIFGFSINADFPDHLFGWTLALGTASVEFKTLANAYAALGTGEKAEICPILSISREDGTPLPSPCEASKTHVLNPKSVFFLGNILSDIEARPALSWRGNITVPDFNLAVKTGTSSVRIENELRPVDNIIVGYSPKNTFLLWAGNTDGSVLKKNSFCVFSIGPLWRDIASLFYEKYPEKYAPFSSPDGLQEIHGEWASAEYKPPSYNPLLKSLRQPPEVGMNPLLPLSFKKEESL